MSEPRESKHDTRLPVTTALLSIPIALQLLAALPPTQSTAEGDRRPPIRRFGEVEVEPGASIGVAIPEPLSTVDLDAWIMILALTPDQAAALRAAVDGFYAARALEVRQAIEPVERAARELARRSGLDLQRLPDAPEAFRDLVRLRNRAASRLAAIEEDLFCRVADAVSPDAPEGVADAIRQLRKRSRCSSTPPKLPMAAVDLRAIETALGKDSPLEIVDRDGWLAAWPSHDAELAALEERRIRLDLDMTVEDLAHFRDSNHDVESLVAYRTNQSRRRLAIERSIIAANQRWASAFAQMLSPTDAQRWLDAARAAAYPTLYPNKVDLRSLLQAVQAREAPDAEGDPGPMTQMLKGEIARLASMESAVELELVALAVSESRDIVAPEPRANLERSIARVQRERCECAARALTAWETSFADRITPELERLKAAMRIHCGNEGSDNRDGTAASPGRGRPSDRPN